MPAEDSAKSPIVEAIRNDDVAAMEKFFAAGLDIDAPIPQADNKRPVQVAMDRFGGRRVAAMLIKAGAKLEQKDLNLYWAVSTKDVDVVKRFIDLGADINIRAIGGTPLCYSAFNNLHEIVKVLVEAGVDIEARSVISTPLEEAVQQQASESAVVLIRAGAKFTPQMLGDALHRKDHALARALLEKGVDVNARVDVSVVNPKTYNSESAYGETTPLIVATRVGDPEMVRELLTAGADPWLQDDSGAVALDWARKLNNPGILAALEEAGAKQPRKIDPDAQLLLAAERGDLREVQALLKSGANVNARDKRKKFASYTPLILAALNGHTQVAEALLDAGADVNASDNLDTKPDKGFNWIVNELGAEGAREQGYQLAQTPLHLAAARGDGKTALLLIRRGADVNALDRAKTHVLMLAAQGGSAELIQALIDKGADVNIRGESRNTALNVAAARGHVEAVQALTNAEAKIELKNDSGSTPLISAAATFKPDVVAVLLKAGANFYETNRSKDSALSAALGTHPILKDVDEKGEIIYRVRANVDDIEKVVRMLVDAGSDVTIVDHVNRTIIERAEQLAQWNPVYKPMYEMVLAAKDRPSPPLPEPKPTSKKKKKPKKATPKIKIRKTGEGLPQPAFKSRATDPDFLEAVAELEKLCGTKRQDMKGIPGAFSCHANTDVNFNLKEAHAQFLKRGFYVFTNESLTKDRIVILPTTDKYQAIAAMQTSAANYDLGTADIVHWLRDLEKKQPFTLTGIGWDFLEGEFQSKVKVPEKLAHRMYAFCPDIVDQGVGSVERLVEELQTSQRFFFWWD